MSDEHLFDAFTQLHYLEYYQTDFREVDRLYYSKIGNITNVFSRTTGRIIYRSYVDSVG